MGNVFSIDLGCDSLIPFCCTPSGIPIRSNIDDLKNHLGALEAKKSDLQAQIRGSPLMKPKKEVNEWLSRAEKIEVKAKKLIAQQLIVDNAQDSQAATLEANAQQVTDHDQNSTNKCFGRRCPKNCRTRFNLWMKIPIMDKQVTDHEQRLPQRVFEEAPIPSPQLLPIEPTTGMQLMIAKVWSHVLDENAGMIGLHGMGGVGKTTLLTEVFNKLCSSTNMFDLQLYIVVSKTPNLDDIQNGIGEKIGLRDGAWKSKKLDQKAIDIFNILEKKKYILFLDDIWERFNLVKDIGIPLPNLTNKSKVIFTTRSEQVCGEMNADKQIQVKCLNEAEAWALFEKNVGETTLNAHPDIPDLAKEVMKECNGLPLALIVVGRAMSRKTSIDEWKHAIDALKENAARLSKKIHDEVFAPLKYSYDNLSDDSLRSCFLYCSLYPEDAFISKKKLIDIWLCEDFLVQSNDLGKERIQGYVNIGILVKANLLEECPFEKVKMHDVIRDMAIWIGGDCGKNQDKFIVKARAGLTQMPNVANWEHTERLSLMDNDIDEPNAKCPNLMTLFLGEANLRSINNGFFEFMPKLRVLDLSRNYQLRSLPKDIGKLVCLRYLDVSHTNVVEFPKELKELRKLKYLNLEGTPIFSISERIVSSLKELRIFKFEDIFEYGNLYKEAESLKYLKDVGRVAIRTKDGMSRFSSSNKLGNCITDLNIAYFDDLICLDLEILRNIKYLEIGEMKTLEKIEVGRHGMILNSLHCLYIFNCDKLMDVSWLEFAPNIEELSVCWCKEMKTMVGEPGRNDNTRVVGGSPFAKLTKLCLVRLVNLESIYHTNLELPRLKELTINDCNKLKDVSWLEFAPNIEVISVFNFKEMKTMVGEPGRNDNTRVVGGSPFTKLTTLRLEMLDNLESIYPTNLLLPRLKSLRILNCNKLEKIPFQYITGCDVSIEGEKSWWDNLKWEDDATRISFSSHFKAIA